MLANISTRLRVLTGDNVLIGGFIVTGTQPKKVVARAIGPTLGTFGLAGTLPDPQLELYNSAGVVIGSNDNWRSSQQAELLSIGLAPESDLEAAVVATLRANSAYTAIVSDRNGSTGVGLIEVYNIEPAADSQLANISSRGFVQTGDNVMIAGFILNGGNTRRVIVRALGPSLPVNGKLNDTILELFNSNGDSLGQNDNWPSDQEAEINASSVPPENNLESAIIRTLNPGAYSAIVRGKNGTTGVGLVEVYALD